VEAVKTMGKLVDEKCVELARHFLSDIEHATAADQKKLAEAIQAACEDACHDIEDRVPADCTCAMSRTHSARLTR
jgi:hypothetical protein